MAPAAMNESSRWFGRRPNTNMPAPDMRRQLHRHRKVLRDQINGVTKPAIRRLARRGGVKRMSMVIYADTRRVLLKRLKAIIQQLVYLQDLKQKKTVTVDDIIFVLNRLGTPIWGVFAKPARNLRL